jgi:hypothetical protein
MDTCGSHFSILRSQFVFRFGVRSRTWRAEPRTSNIEAEPSIEPEHEPRTRNVEV